MDDVYFMKQALEQARIAFNLGEIPVGSVVVCKNKIIARSHNLTETLKDATAHAEMLAITAAAEYLGSKYLNECSLYVTLEPCPMCGGASYWAKIGKIVYGASEEKRKGISAFGNDLIHPKTTIIGGVLADDCGELLRLFFKEKRGL